MPRWRWSVDLASKSKDVDHPTQTPTIMVHLGSWVTLWFQRPVWLLKTIEFPDLMVHIYTVEPNQTPTQAQYLGVNINTRLGNQNALHIKALFTVPSKLNTINPFITDITIYIPALTKGETLILILGKGFLIQWSQEFQMYGFKQPSGSGPSQQRYLAHNGTWFPMPHPLPTREAGTPGYICTSYKTNLGKLNNLHPNYLPIS